MSETSVKDRVARVRGELLPELAESLPGFEGREVTRSKLKLMGAGDGLSDALGLKSKAYSLGDDIYLVVQAHVKRIEHEPDDKESEELARIHTTKVVTITEVSEADVRTFLAIARDRMQKVKDEKSGQQSLLDDAPNAEGPAGLGVDADFDPDELPET
jgi:hypothetical protein